MWPMLILGAAQMASNQQKEDREKKLAAQTQRYSPWTGLKAQPIDYADPAGTAMQTYGAIQGQGQAQGNQAAQQKLIEAQTKYYNRAQPQDSSGPMASAGPYGLQQQQYYQNLMNA